MANTPYHDVVIDHQGNTIAGAQVRVTDYPSGNLSTIYDISGLSIANPVTTDSDGMYTFYAPTGHYTLTVSSRSGSKTITDIFVPDTTGGGGGGGSADTSWQYPTGLVYNDSSNATQTANTTYLNTFFSTLAATGRYYSVKFTGYGTLYLNGTISIDVGKVAIIDCNNITINGSGKTTAGPIILIFSSLTFPPGSASATSHLYSQVTGCLTRLTVTTNYDQSTGGSTPTQAQAKLKYNPLVDGIEYRSNGTSAPFGFVTEKVVVTNCLRGFYVHGGYNPFLIFKEVVAHDNVVNVRYNEGSNGGENHRWENFILGGGMCGNFSCIANSGTRLWLNAYGGSIDYPANYVYENTIGIAPTPDTINTDGNVALTAANVVNGVTRTNCTAVRTDTLPSAANIMTALGTSAVGSQFFFKYYNNSGKSVQLKPGDGTTILFGAMFEDYTSGSTSTIELIDDGQTFVWIGTIYDASSIVFMRGTNKQIYAKDTIFTMHGGHIEHGSSRFPLFVCSGDNASIILHGCCVSDTFVVGSGSALSAVYPVGTAAFPKKYIGYLNGANTTFRMLDCNTPVGINNFGDLSTGLQDYGEHPLFLGTGEVLMENTYTNNNNNWWNLVRTTGYNDCMVHGTWDIASVSTPVHIEVTGSISQTSLYTTGTPLAVSRDTANYAPTYYNLFGAGATGGTQASWLITKNSSGFPLVNIWIPVSQYGQIAVGFYYYDRSGVAHGTFDVDVFAEQAYPDENGLMQAVRGVNLYSNFQTPTNVWKRWHTNSFTTSLRNKYKWSNYILIQLDLTLYSGTQLNIDDIRVVPY